MKEIQLTKGMVAYVDDEDFERVSQYKWTYSLMQRKNHYAIRAHHTETGKRTTQLLHRFILGEIPEGMVVDHKDGNGLNNCRSNLRICTQSQNQINKRKKGVTSKYKGVYYEKARGKYRSHIVVDGKINFLGRYNTELEAALAYDKASIMYHGEFANNNGLIKEG